MKFSQFTMIALAVVSLTACNKNDKMSIEKSRIDSLKNIQFETEQFADVQIGNDDLPVDRVSGYTIKQLESSYTEQPIGMLGVIISKTNILMLPLAM